MPANYVGYKLEKMTISVIYSLSSITRSRLLCTDNSRIPVESLCSFGIRIINFIFSAIFTSTVV